MQQTLLIFKPDAVASRLWTQMFGFILSKPGVLLKAMRLEQFTDADINAHYAEHIGKDFFERNKNFMLEGPSILAVLSGENVIHDARAQVLSFRLMYQCVNPRNLMHASDSEISAAREIGYFFP